MADLNVWKDVPGQAADGLDDAVSLTSTDNGVVDEDTEYIVEAVLTQEEDEDGENIYLIKWENYSMQECTWEPENHLGSELLHDMWEQKIREPGYKPFDMNIFYQASEEKAERHRRRNAKRKRLGLPLTEPLEESVLDREDIEDVTYQPDVDLAAELHHGNQERKSPRPNKAYPSFQDNSLSDDDLMIIESLSSSPPPRKSKSPKQEKQKGTKKEKDKTKGNDKQAQKRRHASDETPIPSPTAGSSTKNQTRNAQGDGERDGQISGHTESRTAPKETLVSEAAKGGPKAGRSGKSTSPSLAGKGKAPSQPSLLESMRKSALSSRNHAETLFDTDRRQQNQPNRAATKPKPPPISTSPLGNQLANPQPSTNASSSRAATVKISGGTKTFSARKSGTNSQDALGNAFSGGRVSKRNYNFASAMADPSRQSTLFRNHRKRRLAELRGRSKEDISIDPSVLSTQLFPITRGPSTMGATSPEEELPSTTPQKRRSRTVSEDAPSPQTTSVTPENTDGLSTAKLKRKKSVRFFDDSDETPSPEALTPEPPDNGQTNELPHDMYASQDKEAKQSLEKKLVLGCQSNPIEASFEDVPSAPPLPLLTEFVDTKTLSFEYACLAETFLSQFDALGQETLFGGDVADVGRRDDAKSGPLETASEKLKVMNSGLLLFRPAFGILLYPSHSEDWNEKVLGLSAENKETEATMRYVVFSTQLDCLPFLRSCNAVPNSLTVPVGDINRKYLMQTMFHFDSKSYMNRFPQTGRGPEARRSVFLAFPPSLFESMQEFALLFRTLDPGCLIFFSSRQGAWAAFRDSVVAKSMPAAILIHELVTWSVRRFPDIALILNYGDCHFWSLAQGHFEYPMYPSNGYSIGEFENHENYVEGSNADDELTLPGRIGLTPLFRSGIAILITPSFIVSEPFHAYELFDWFIQAQATSTVPMKLVVASGILEYLQDLAKEKDMLRRNIRTKSMPYVKRQMETNLNGVTNSLCEYRYRTWLLVDQILTFYTSEEPSAVYRESCPLVLVDKAISPHDEQSLVNWFGWWSIVHLDEFREFYVVGSDPTTKPQGSEESTRHVPLAWFSKDMDADPDSAAGQVLPPEPTRKIDSSIHAAAEGTTIGATKSTTTAPVTAPAPVSKTQQSRSKRFPNELPSEFAAELMQYNEKDPAALWKCYRFVVLWKNDDEAICFDAEAGRYTVDAWFNFTWSFLKVDMDFRTYFGLFYTVDDICYTEGVLRGRKLPRHPWVLIYRPDQPHIRPFRRTELIIWDVRATDKFRHVRYPKEEDLTLSQQAAIDYVRRFGMVKNPNMPLVNLWIGGEMLQGQRGNAPSRMGPRLSRTQPASTPTALPENELDATMAYMDILTGDFKNVLPPTIRSLKERGFRQVSMSSNPTGARQPHGTGGSIYDQKTDDPMDLDTQSRGTMGWDGANDSRGNGDADRDTDGRDMGMGMDLGSGNVTMVFHAPRGTNKTPSKCRNRLVDKCQEFQAKNPTAKEMMYSYPPTLEWYEEQKAEGRGYSHIKVDSWQPIFDRLGIGQNGKSSKNGTSSGAVPP